MDRDRLQFGSLYLTRFAGSFGYITVLTLLPTYIDLLDPSGVEIGLFVTALGVGSLSVPLLGVAPAGLPVLVALNGLLGIADAFREPASMAPFADEGKGEGIASSIGIRSLVWRPGAIAAPMAGGWLMATAGMEWVFFLAGAAAISGALTFLAVLAHGHGRRALTRW